MTRGRKPISKELTPLEREEEQKAVEAVKLKMAGLTFEQIAHELRYSNRGAAFKAYQRGLALEGNEVIDEKRKLMAHRLDSLWRPMYVKALTGDRLAVDRCLRIMERQAALHGLDAPIRIQQMVVTAEQFEEAIERFNAEAAAMEAAGEADYIEGFVVEGDEEQNYEELDAED